MILSPADALRELSGAKHKATDASPDDAIAVSDLAADHGAIEATRRAIRHGGPMLLSGPPGSGKTTTVAALGASEHETVVFIDAADVSTASLASALRGATNGSSRETRTVVENCESRGAAAAIAAALRGAQVPPRATFIVSERYGAAGSTLGRVVTHDVRFPPISETRITWALARVARTNGWNCNARDVRAAAQRSRGDLRAALRALQWSALCPDTAVTGTGPGSDREPRDVFEATNRLLTVRTGDPGEVDRVHDMLRFDRAPVLAHVAQYAPAHRSCTLRHAVRLSSALSDEDASQFAEESALAVALAGRACWQSSAAPSRIARFARAEAFGAAPRESAALRDLTKRLGSHIRGRDAAVEIGRMACLMESSRPVKKIRSRSSTRSAPLPRDTQTLAQRILAPGGRLTPAVTRAGIAAATSP